MAEVSAALVMRDRLMRVVDGVGSGEIAVGDIKNLAEAPDHVPARLTPYEERVWGAESRMRKYLLDHVAENADELYRERITKTELIGLSSVARTIMEKMATGSGEEFTKTSREAAERISDAMQSLDGGETMKWTEPSYELARKLLKAHGRSV